MDQILLIGFMGAGKTTFFHLLKTQECFQNYQFYELDHEIEKRLGVKIPLIIEKRGLGFFREVESELLEELSNDKCIIGCGGGIVESTKNENILSHSRCIYFKASKEVLFQRVIRDINFRPIIYDETQGKYQKEKFFELYDIRIPLYEKFADLTVDTEINSADSVICEIVKYFC